MKKHILTAYVFATLSSSVSNAIYGLAFVFLLSLPYPTTLHAQEHEFTKPIELSNRDIEKNQFTNSSDHNEQINVTYENINADFANADYLEYDKIKLLSKVRHDGTQKNSLEGASNIVTIKGLEYEKIGNPKIVKNKVIDIKIADTVFTEVTAITIEDNFTLTKTVDTGFYYIYSNTYVELYSKDDNHLATIKYIKYSVENLASEYKSIYIDPSIQSSSKHMSGKSLTVVPNPASSSATVNFEILSETEPHVVVDIYDVTGKYIKNVVNDNDLTHGTHSYDINISELSSGFYYLQLNTSSTTANTKFIVKH